MQANGKSLGLLNVVSSLKGSSAEKHQPVEGVAEDPILVILRAWQSNRLKDTYADLLKDKRYWQACLFFLNDIYGSHDFSQRDYDFQRLYKFLSRFLPDVLIKILANAIELNGLSNALDQKLLSVLVNDLDMQVEVNPELYAEGYRLCDNYAERAYQINMTVKLLKEVVTAAHLPFMGMALKLAQGPAYAYGWFDLYGFLERGYAAAKTLRDVKGFAAAIQERETRILDQIYAGHPNPFQV